jgi:hypothetical protein
MRTARLPAGLALALLLVAGARGQTPPYEATIALAEVEVRSGPSASTQFYPTIKLRQGAPVKVLREESGWLAIAPPPGSFSWVNARLIEVHPNEPSAHIVTEAPVLIGSSLSNATPTVSQVKLDKGTQVMILDPKPFTPPGQEAGGVWYMIAPPPREVRYIPREAIKVASTVESVSAAPPAPGASATPGWPTPGGVAASVAAGGGDLWAQAEQMERAGNIPRAIELYTQLARQVIDSDHALAMRCFNRIQFLRDGNRGSAPAGYQVGRPSEASTAPADNRLVPTPTGNVPAQPTAQTQVGYNATPPAAAGMQSSGPGRLRRAGFLVDGKQAYVLENSQGRPLLYATGQGNMTLDPYLNRGVELWGPLIYRGDLRTNYMTVNHVVLLP